METQSFSCACKTSPNLILPTTLISPTILPTTSPPPIDLVSAMPWPHPPPPPAVGYPAHPPFPWLFCHPIPLALLLLMPLLPILIIYLPSICIFVVWYIRCVGAFVLTLNRLKNESQKQRMAGFSVLLDCTKYTVITHACLALFICFKLSLFHVLIFSWHNMHTKNTWDKTTCTFLFSSFVLIITRREFQ